MTILSIKIVIILTIALVSICSSMFLAVICIKLRQGHNESKRNADIQKIKPVLRKIFSEDTVTFFRNREQMISLLDGKVRDKSTLKTLEDLLLNILENKTGETKIRALAIAYHFGFPEACLSMIRDRLTANIAIGCRKAGFYQADQAVPDILKVLDIISGDVQFQALMALAHIGNTAAMIQALNKIYRLILVNERAFSEILDTFSGDRYELYKNMIHHESDYLVRLCLKGIDRDSAGLLIDDIVSVYRRDSKETRLAGIIAIGRSEKSGKIFLLIDAMKDKEWEIRAMAAKTLGSLTDPDALLPLAKAARDREWWVRQNAVTSILAYPNHEEVLISIAQTGDNYAYDSMLCTLAKANKQELLSRVKAARFREQRNIQMKENSA